MLMNNRLRIYKYDVIFKKRYEKENNKLKNMIEVCESIKVVQQIFFLNFFLSSFGI